MQMNIIIPVLNEELRLEKGVVRAINFLENKLLGQYVITVIDNGSFDRTQEIAESLVLQYKDRVRYLRIDTRGVGAAFRKGIAKNTSDVVGYMDVDLSTDLEHLIQVFYIFKEDKNVEIVNGSRLSKGSKVVGRKANRNITSNGLKFILKLIFQMKINDAICGFKFFRKETAEFLVLASSQENGWFFCIELLLRAEKLKITIREIPVMWKDDYNTTVNVPKLIANYLKCIFQLFWNMKIMKK